MHSLLKHLGLVQREEAQLEYERRHGRLMAARAAHERVAELHREGMIAAATWERLDEELRARAKAHMEAQQALLQAQPALRAAELDEARREALRAERTTLAELHSGGVLSEPIYSELVGEVDAALAEGDYGMVNGVGYSTAVVAALPVRLVDPGEHEGRR